MATNKRKVVLKSDSRRSEQVHGSMRSSEAENLAAVALFAIFMIPMLAVVPEKLCVSMPVGLALRFAATKIAGKSAPSAPNLAI
jgi:hypothetical protein